MKPTMYPPDGSSQNQPEAPPGEEREERSLNRVERQCQAATPASQHRAHQQHRESLPGDRNRG